MNQGEQKIQLTMANNFISSNDSNETLTMNYVRDDTEIVIGYETDEIIDQIFDSLLQRYKKDQKIGRDTQKLKKSKARISKAQAFIDQYNWKGINFPSHKEDWKNSIALKSLIQVPYNTEKIGHPCKSKHKLTRENQVIILMIADGKKNDIILL